MACDIRINKINVLRKRFIKGPKYREIRSINLERGKHCILQGRDIFTSSWFCTKWC